MNDITSLEIISSKIFIIRGKRVMLDRDLSKLYGVETKYLIRQIKRNSKRFPDDFMYVLSSDEIRNLRCQNVTSSWGGRRYPPYVFTQEGLAMLSSVLNSERAIQVNILIMRAFVRLKEALVSYDKLAGKINELEKKYIGHDEKMRDIFEAIRQLVASPPEKKRRITGFSRV